jgi:hypothetical protein
VEQWRREQKRWREQVRAARRDAAQAPPSGIAPLPSGRGTPLPAPSAPPPAPMNPAQLEQRFYLFSRRAKKEFVTIGVLGFINLVTFPIVPWAALVWWSKWKRLRPDWLPLREVGVTWGDVMDGRLPAHLGGRDPHVVKLEAREQEKAARLEARAQARKARVVAHWRDYGALERRAGRFRAATFTTASAAGLAAASLGVGAPLGIEALIPVFALSSATTVGAGVYAAALGRKLRKAGVRLRAMLKDEWQGNLRAADPRPRATLLAEELEKLVSPEVLAGPHGPAVRQAVEDRAEVRESFAKMSPADRAMLPDVTATVDGLVGRVALLAQALDRLDRDRPEAMLAALEERLAVAEREAAGSPDRERRLGLLQRQRATLEDLVRRRATLAAQLESAALVLESVRLDLLKLRSAGLQAALEDVTSATQEARALSREIGHVLDAAAEVRAL